MLPKLGGGSEDAGVAEVNHGVELIKPVLKRCSREQDPPQRWQRCEHLGCLCLIILEPSG